MIDISKYTFYTDEKAGIVVALSTFAKKPVRGKAKCDPRDDFSTSDGMLIAAARCNERIAEKRLKNAQARYEEAIKQLEEAKKQFEKMSCYFTDAAKKKVKAKAEREEIESSYRGE